MEPGPTVLDGGLDPRLRGSEPGHIGKQAEIGQPVLMLVDEAGGDRATLEVDDLGLRAGQGQNLVVTADGNDQIAGDGDGLGHRPTFLHGQHGPVVQDDVDQSLFAGRREPVGLDLTPGDP